MVPQWLFWVSGGVGTVVLSLVSIVLRGVRDDLTTLQERAFDNSRRIARLEGYNDAQEERKRRAKDF